jgi:hypothetical protein
MLDSAGSQSGTNGKNPFLWFRLPREPRERCSSPKKLSMEWHLEPECHSREMAAHPLCVGSTDTDLSILAGWS